MKYLTEEDSLPNRKPGASGPKQTQRQPGGRNRLSRLPVGLSLIMKDSAPVNQVFGRAFLISSFRITKSVAIMRTMPSGRQISQLRMKPAKM